MALDLETREQLIDTVRRFVTERLRPLEAKVSEDDAIPAEVVEEMKGLGLFGLSIADGLQTQCDYRFVPGMSLGWTWDFVLPIKVDDVLHVRMRVGAMRLSKSRPGWGIVVLPSELINQHGQVVQRGEHRLMVPCKGAA